MEFFVTVRKEEMITHNKTTMPKRPVDDDDEEDEGKNPQLRSVSRDSTEDQEYKPGSIRRVRLKNFLTYNNVEFQPGPRLNVVIGPNGTGKSTILCAICLGLGGQPPLLGRADDARTFISHNQEVAEIEIELAPHKNATKHIIRRIIDRSKGAEGGKGIGSNTYFINNKSVNIKAVQTLVKDTYSISIENLCTFLPQDRVGSFSAIDSKGLLHETEKSLSGSQQLYHDHMALIRLEEEFHSSGTDLTAIRDKLAKLEEDHGRLETEKKKLEERQVLVQQIKLLRQKKIWLEFDQAKEKMGELKDKRQEYKDKAREAEKSLEPMKEQIEVMDHDLERSKVKSREVEKNIQSSLKNMESGPKSAEKLADEIETLINNLNSLDASRKAKETRVKEYQVKLNAYEQALADFPPAADLQETLKVATEEKNQARRLTTELRRSAESKMGQLKEKKEARDRLAKKMEQMKDEKARRNENIFRSDPKLNETFQFVEQIKRELRHPVWGPVVCEITTKNASAASYLESHVAKSVLETFIVECREDYNLLYREAREKRGLKINIMVIEGGQLNPIERNYSDSRMATFKRDHGIISYLDESFEAPSAVMQALIDSSSVHTVLIGSAKTQESLDKHGLLNILSEREDGKGPRNCCIFSTNQNKPFKYTSNISRYSGKPALRVDEVFPARMLSPGVSPEEKQSIQEKFDAAKREVEALEPEVLEASAAIDKAGIDGQEAHSKVIDATKALNERAELEKKVETVKRHLKDAAKELSKGDENEKKGIVKSLKTHISQYIGFLESSSLHCDEWMKANLTLAGLKLNEEAIFEKKSKLDSLLKERKEDFAKLSNDFETAHKQYELYKNRAKELMEKAKEFAQLKDADGNDTPLKAELEKLPSDLLELDALLDEASNKVNAVHDNPEVLRRYEEQRVEIERIKLQLENMNHSKDLKRNEIRCLRDPWEASLISAMNNVNELFSNYMKELGCAGEVKIARGSADGDNDARGSNTRTGDSLGNFKDWGIQIRVKFREKSELQTLSAHVHSGGERSVSTIMYLMALQDKMVSPFRCVDEINQGLDERNERLVFRRIVENATKPPVHSRDPMSHSGQYFLITPKLLPNLTDMENENVTVLCIFNGPRNFRHFSDWNVESFLSNKPHETEEKVDDGDDEDNRPRKKRVISD